MEGDVDLDQIRALIELAQEYGLSELTVETGDVKVSVKQGPTQQRTRAPQGARSADAAEESLLAGIEETWSSLPASNATTAADHLKPITAPMVGTFYRAANPDAPPFVREGDTIQVGQTVCIIEAMKLFNEIQSEVAGRVIKIVADNGAPVEYGQPLFLVEPLAR
jgi:acetyl-CoA carboxylase biotin carboxyl carrier protein